MEKILESSFTEEIRKSYLTYALSVIVGRAIPDARDGLKPVQRRILYSMYELNLMPNRPFRKSATVVGDVIGKYHPHGDQAVYDALVRMAQDFSMRYPLVEGQGNFGSIDGDPPAAYRYTEARLSRISMELLEDIEEQTVDFVPNFDNRLREPTLLPAKFPNLLVNGSSGIAVGMATNIPPHNLSDIVDALVKLIDEPEISDEELLNVVKGPDFPTGGIIVGVKGLKEAYLTGKGKITLRGRYFVEGKKIIITEIPYGVSKASLIRKIAELVRAGRIEGISDLRDESDKEGLRIVVEVKKGFDPKLVVNQLLKYTKLQDTYGINMLAILDNEPKLLNLRQALEVFLNFRRETVSRRSRYRLEKARRRLHLVEGFLKALDIMSQIIQIIRDARDAEHARNELVSRFKFTHEQAKAILELRLQNLTKLERSKLERERDELRSTIDELEEILASRKKLDQVIRKELLELKQKYGDERRTTILPDEDEKVDIDIQQLIQKENVVVILTRQGYIKRIPLKNFRSQNRNTKGRSGITLHDGDYPFRITVANTHSYVLFTTNTGRMFWTQAYNIPEMSFSSKGKHIGTLFKIEEGEYFVSMHDITEYEYKYIVIVTRKGEVKRLKLQEILSGRKGTSVVSLKEGDEVVAVVPTVGSEDIVIVSQDGKGVRIAQEDIPVRSRKASTIRGMNSDNVVHACAVIKDTSLLLISSRGYGKRLKEDELRRFNRGSKGIYLMKLSRKSGMLLRVVDSFREDEELVILTRKGMTLRLTTSTVPTLGRNTVGVLLMNLSDDDEVVDAYLLTER